MNTNTVTRTNEEKAMRALQAEVAREQVAKGNSRIQGVFFATTKDSKANTELKVAANEIFRVARMKVTVKDSFTGYQEERNEYVVISSRVVEYGFFPTTLDSIVARELLVSLRKDGNVVFVGQTEVAVVADILADFGIF